MKEMKTLTLNGVKFEIVDEKAREQIDALQKSSGGTVDPAEVQRIVNEYLAANPPEAGKPGNPGKDGVSPTIAVEIIDGGHRITITDANGTKSFDVMDGKDGSGSGSSTPGAPGKDGEDGFSPTVTITPIEGGHRVTITDTKGDQSFEIMNGRDGDPGKDGFTPVKGKDYFTPEEIAEVAQQAADLVEIPNPEIEQLDAEKVFFSQDLLTTTAIGNIKLSNGQATIPAAGKNLKQVWDSIFVQEKNPATTQPSVQITFDQAKAYEVGTKVTPEYSATLKAGSYTYGPATGIKATAWTVTDTDKNTADTASGSFPELTVSDNTSYKITAKASYEDGKIPLTNTGNEYPDGQIKAGTKSATSSAITGYRNSFYGTLSDKGELTSGIIRGLSGVSGEALMNGNSFDVAIPVGALRVVIAYPATLRDISSIKDVNGMSAEISSSFVPQTVSVEGANGFQAIDYKVYTLDFANANDTANTFKVTI